MWLATSAATGTATARRPIRFERTQVRRCSARWAVRGAAAVSSSSALPGATPSSASGSLGSAWLTRGGRPGCRPTAAVSSVLGGDRLLVARAGEHRAEQNEEEDEGQAGQADADPLHALPVSTPRALRTDANSSRALCRTRGCCCEALAEKRLTARCCTGEVMRHEENPSPPRRRPARRPPRARRLRERPTIDRQRRDRRPTRRANAPRRSRRRR